MSSKKMHVAASCVIALCLARSAGAVSSYSFVAGQSDYQVAPGVNVDVSLFLSENSGSLISNDNGLFAAGLKVTRAGSGSSLPFINSISAAFGFDGAVQPVASASVASLYEDHAAAFGPGTLPDASHLVLLGILHLNSGLGGVQTLFQITDDNPLSTNTLTYAGTALDAAAGISPGTFTLSVAPEPAGLCGTAFLLLLCARRKTSRLVPTRN